MSTSTPVLLLRPADSRVMIVARTGPQGPAGEGTATLVKGVAVNLKTVAATSLFTATAVCVPFGAVVRISSSSAFVSGASFHFRRVSDGKLFNTITAYPVLNATDECAVVLFAGTIPRLAIGQAIEINVTTGASATTLTAAVDILGYEV